MNNVIIACDFPSKKELKKFLKNFGSEKLFLKIGYELFYREGIKLIKMLKRKGHKIFLDLKLHDIPNTVGMGVKSLVRLNVDLLTIHCSGGSKMMMEAKKSAAESNSKLLGVTELTSTTSDMLQNELLVQKSMNEAVMHFAGLAFASQLDGVVCSAQEAKDIKKKFPNFLIVTPGIRLKSGKANDQARVTTPKEARQNGATHIVVGRPITKTENPQNVYKQFVQEFNK